MHFTHKDVPRGFRIPFGPWVIPPLGALLCLLLMITSSKETGIRLAVWLGIGQVIYFTYGYWNSKLRLTKRTSSVVVVDPLAPMAEDQTIENEYIAEMDVLNEKKF